jgi:hypothetical protein
MPATDRPSLVAQYTPGSPWKMRTCSSKPSCRSPPRRAYVTARPRPKRAATCAAVAIRSRPIHRTISSSRAVTRKPLRGRSRLVRSDHRLTARDNPRLVGASSRPVPIPYRRASALARRRVWAPMWNLAQTPLRKGCDRLAVTPRDTLDRSRKAGVEGSNPSVDSGFLDIDTRRLLPRLDLALAQRRTGSRPLLACV